MNWIKSENLMDKGDVKADFKSVANMFTTQYLWGVGIREDMKTGDFDFDWITLPKVVNVAKIQISYDRRR